MMYVACFISVGKTKQVNLFIMMYQLYKYLFFVRNAEAFMNPGFDGIIITVVVDIIVGSIVPYTGIMYYVPF